MQAHHFATAKILYAEDARCQKILQLIFLNIPNFTFPEKYYITFGNSHFDKGSGFTCFVNISILNFNDLRDSIYDCEV